MIRDLILSTPWPGIVLWSVLYLSDWRLTLHCARLYRNGVSDRLVFEGSYELTPCYQRDIDALRSWSPRVFIVLTASATLLWLIWLASNGSDFVLYEIVLGCLLLLELVVHVRHFRNLFMFRTILRNELVRGRIEYPRDVMLMSSSVELFAFSVLLAIVFAVSGSLFVLGGTISCAWTAAQHRTMARQHTSGSEKKQQQPAPLHDATKIM